MSVKYLPVLAIALLAAGCNRQHGQQAVSTTTPAQAATPAAGRDPEPVERAAPPAPELPPVSARVADEPSQPRETGAEARHPAEAVIPA
jgi:hypothetical protein